jgi:hypothetical protein
MKKKLEDYEMKKELKRIEEVLKEGKLKTIRPKAEESKEPV